MFSMRFTMERQSFWNKLPVYTFSSTYGGKKRQIDFFSFFFPIENPNSQVFTNSSFSKETVESPFLLIFFFKEFALVPRVGFLSCSSKMRRQNAFHWCSTCPHIFFFCFPYFVLSHLFITACIWHACKCLFLFFVLTSAPLIFVFSL